MPMRFDCLRMLGCWACLLSFSLVAMATETAESSTTDFAAIRGECAENIGRIKGQLSLEENATNDDSSPLLDELALWRQIELVVAQRKGLFEAQQLGPANPEVTVASEAGIFSFSQMEEARDAIAVNQASLEAVEGELRAEHAMMLETKEMLQRAEQDRRRRLEGLSGTSTKPHQQLNAQQRLDSLRVRLTRQQLALHRDTIVVMTERRDQLVAVTAGQTQRVERASPSIRLSESELELQLSNLAEMEQVVRRQLTNLEQRMHLVLVTSPDGQTAAAARQLEVIREESQLLRQLLTEIAEMSECWNRRFRFSNRQAPASDWVTWREEARDAEQRLSGIHRRLSGRTLQRRQQVLAIQRSAANAAADGGPLGADTAAELQDIEAIIDEYGNLQLLAERGRRTYIRFAEDLEARQSLHAVRIWTAWAGDRLQAFWHYELTTVDDRSVTIGKLVIALLLLIVGLIISKCVSSVTAFRILPRFGFSHASATTIHQIMMYGLIVATTMLSLQMVNVPLAIFAFLGGAAAIGVGFGSQNAVSNFISGLILLLHRPIRIGDLVNVDGIDANVEHIGARATRVRTSENLEVLIPNSNILHNKVTNWTLSDTRIRTCVTVGVAYGTEVKPVIGSLESVVSQHPKVLSDPKPVVLFDDFGDSSLVFKVHFWIHMPNIMEGHEVRSDVRVAIDDAFRRENIVIAFPQRDVHLDLTSPVEVALTDAMRGGFAGATRRAA